MPSSRSIKVPITERADRTDEIDLSKAKVIGRGLGKHRRIALRSLRVALGKSQGDVADGAEMDQGDVSRLERREDMLVSTLGRYARALGGQLEVAIVVGGRRYLVEV